MTRVARAILLFIALSAAGFPASALSFDLDSIAAMGKFPRFCVGVYRWGDHFFNDYDTTYVEATGKKWNIKMKTDSWTDTYDFRLDNRYRMEMVSDPSTSLGFHLSYMALSVGYDVNISKYLTGNDNVRKRFNFQFNCSRFSAELYTVENDVGTTIRRMGMPGEVEKVNLDFSGINNRALGIELYYFLNNRHYSQAAAFNYSKIQRKSAGSMYVGFSYFAEDYHFDFSTLPEADTEIPTDWDHNYVVVSKTYAVKFGYAYNWVFHPGWCLGVSESPVVGVRKGRVNHPGEKDTTFSLNNRFRIGIVYNYKTRWFFGLSGSAMTGIINDPEHTLIANTLTAEASVGFRFNLW
ncbi:MAG: DUF4421 domain-containing protein [Muribaculaceae bacterium]|nr:DUF4421 domain-containing protein [Muribaculaceae bacterium]